MFFVLSTLWLVRETKAILFRLYLWQLKEYRIGRFLDHFRTEKGEKLLFNPLIFLKILLVLGLFFFTFLGSGWVVVFPLILALIYFGESIITFKNLLQKRLKKPVLTKKAVFLISAALILEILALLIIFLNVKEIIWFNFWLLAFDISTPAIISAIVLFFQPLTVLLRNQIFKKAKEKRAGFKNLLVIGITGSYGKTSTKEFLATILGEKFNILKTKEHQNTEIGVSQCILNDLKPEHEIFICEMGAYKRGEIKLLGDITKPKIGILTGINEQHLATFGSLENIIKTKYELIESLPKDGAAFFNAKNRYCQELYQKTKIKKILYGEAATFSGEENILGAMAVARELGMTEEEISKAIAKIENKFPGIEIKKGINGLNIIDATYSANPDGAIAHLEYLKIWPGKKVIVMPCLIELGSASKEIHKRIGQKIGEVCDLAIITTKERFEEIKEGAVGRGMNSENILFIENPKEIFEKIKSFCKEGDTILLESRLPSELIKQLTL